MGKVSRADSTVYEMVDRLIAQRYPFLQSATIGVLMANGVKEHGFEVAAKVKINDEAGRVDGLPDVTITIDRVEWDMLGLQIVDGPKQRLAILDAILYSLEPRLDKDGEHATDDHGRPLFDKRPPDWVLCGYAAMARRHGANSREVIEAGRLKEEYGELLFGFMEGDEAEERPVDVYDPNPAVCPPFTPGLKLFGCNKCNLRRVRSIPVCPACQCPEYCLLIVNDDLEAVRDVQVDAPRKGRKAEPAGATA